MLLAIDSGNTNIVFAVYEGREQRGVWRAVTNPGRTSDEFAAWLSQLMSLGDRKIGEIDAAIISNVVPASMFNLVTFCRRYLGFEPMVIGDPAIRLNIGVMMNNPEEVGADRLVNAVGAHIAYSGPLVVVDFGTATTFDVIDGDGNYKGGIIAPGAGISATALHQAAAKLPLVAIQRPSSVIGRSTVVGMQSGLYWGYVGLIEGLVGRIQKEQGFASTVIATGGLARLFDNATPVIQHVDPDLTLRGLVEIYHRNTE